MCVQLEPRRQRSPTRPSGRRCSRGSASARARSSRMVRSAYHLLCLRTFLTTGNKESRGLDVWSRSTGLQCAGLHTDFQAVFIRAEVINWDELLVIGSWTKAKGLGKVRVEDGDVIEFRFNV